MSHVTHRWLLARTLAVLACILVLGLAVRPHLAAAVQSTVQSDPVTAAWTKARTAGSYEFTSNIVRVTLPSATLANVGRTSRTEKLYLEGQNNLRQNKLEMKLWSGGGSVLQTESSVAIKIENDKTWIRTGSGEWRASESVTDAFAPQGDFMAYLRAVRDVTAHPAEQRAGITFTRYTFTLDGPAFAVYLHDQLEAAMRAKGELPADMNLEVPRAFQAMTGSGELWIKHDGLPLRQILTLQFPEQNAEQVHAEITVDFSKFGAGQPVASHPSSMVSRWLQTKFGGVLPDFGVLAADLGPFLVLLPLLALAVLMLRYRRVRLVELTIVTTVIFSQVASPLLNTYTNVKFFDAQTVKAAAKQEQQATVNQARNLRDALGQPKFNPHLSPLERGDQRLETKDSPVEANLQSPVSKPHRLRS